MAKYDFYLRRTDDNSITKGINADIDFIKSMLYKLEWKSQKNIKTGTASTGKAKRNKKSINKDRIQN